MPRPKVPDTDLFDAALAEQLRAEAPLADRLRPTVWQDFVGQKEVIGSGTPLRQLIEQDQVPSLIFWGPPGSGKTTLARLIAKLTRSDFIQLPAVASGLADLRQVVARASDRRKLHQTRTILFIDEIHRWNKAQQDALLPHVENGTVTLIGATTENPSFEVISALLSRCRVIIIKALAPEDIESILQRALKDKEYGFGKIKVEGATQAIKHLAIMASGDARVALNTLELAVKASLKDNQSVITDELIKQSLQRTHLVYDKGGEEHFNLISALHKSMRGSNPDAAFY
ncbi:MAG: AAA ATPase central domain protein, partial [Parcubacteria group bacterium GW2011_GWD1_42_9]